MAKLEYTISAVWNDKVLEVIESLTDRVEKLEAENKALIELIKPDALIKGEDLINAINAKQRPR